MEERRTLVNVEWLRIIAIIAVVFIHVDFYYTYTILPAMRFAVPLFFMISGYFIGNRAKNKQWKKYIVDAFLLLFWATTFYALVECVGAWYNDTSILLWPWRKIWIKWIVFNVNPFHYHLWFLGAYLYVICIAALIDKWQIWDTAYWFIIPLLLGRFILQWYNLPSCITRNFLFVGMPCFLLGSWMRNLRYSPNYKLLICACAVFTILPFLEDMVLFQHAGVQYGDFLSSYILAFLLLRLATECPQFTKIPIPRNTRDIVLFVYIFHPFVEFIYRHLIPIQIAELYHTWLAPFLVFITTWLLAYPLLWVVDYAKHRLLLSKTI